MTHSRDLGLADSGWLLNCRHRVSLWQTEQELSKHRLATPAPCVRTTTYCVDLCMVCSACDKIITYLLDYFYYFQIDDHRHIHTVYVECWYLCTCRGIVNNIQQKNFTFT